MNTCPVVCTSNGKVKGFVSKPTLENSSYVFNFFSIPYGKAPIKKRRFKPPEKAECWDGVLEATTTLVNCPQNYKATENHDNILPYNVSMQHKRDASSEDCLRLSVFTPSCDKNAKLPVMVWLTGGGYQRNTCGRVDGTSLSGINQVVTVVLNFRVNTLGFLYLGKACKGNMGLLDVQLGLRWVKEEILNFGGNPENVTLFGESSGAGMTNLLMLSPLSEGLFHKVILQSGVAISSFFWDSNPEENKSAMIKKLGISSTMKSDEEIFEYLQNCDLEVLESLYSSILGEPGQFQPVVDGHVIPDEPMNLLKAGKYMKVPMILGCTDSEAGCLLTRPYFPDFFQGPSEQSVKDVLSFVLFSKYPKVDEKQFYDSIKQLYFKDSDSPFKYLEMHTEFSADGIFVIPTLITAQMHSAQGLPTFLYYMKQKPDFSHNVENGKNIIKKPSFVSCDHCDDLNFVFGSPFIKDGLNFPDAYFTQDEKEFSLDVMRYFTNFALSGDPNTGKKVDVVWPRYDNNKSHLELKSEIVVSSALKADKQQFFMQILDS